jgi:hypothetical protein
VGHGSSGSESVQGLELKIHATKNPKTKTKVNKNSELELQMPTNKKKGILLHSKTKRQAKDEELKSRGFTMSIFRLDHQNFQSLEFSW